MTWTIDTFELAIILVVLFVSLLALLSATVWIYERRIEKERDLSNWIIDNFETLCREYDIPYEINRWIKR